eukprot:gene3921-4466_t
MATEGEEGRQFERLRVVRRGNRAVVTKLQREAEKTIYEQDGSEVANVISRLDSLSVTLTAKQKYLSTLDEEILTKCKTNELEQEIEETADWHMKINEILSRIDRFIKEKRECRPGSQENSSNGGMSPTRSRSSEILGSIHSPPRQERHRANVCKSNRACKFCKGNHHQVLCEKGSESERQTAESTNNAVTATSTTNSFVLMQTATAFVSGENGERTKAIILFYSGSQKSYITKDLMNKLNIKPQKTESINLNTFGSENFRKLNLDVVKFNLEVEGGVLIPIGALSNSVICTPLATRVSVDEFPHLQGLSLADSFDSSEVRKIDVLIGLDHYYDVISGEIIRGSSGPIALRSKLGWLLSGVVDGHEFTTNLATNVVSSLVIDCLQTEPNREENNREISDALREFWKHENFGLDAGGSMTREIEVDHVSKIGESDSSAAKNEWHIQHNGESESISEVESSIAMRERVSKPVEVTHTILSNSSNEATSASEIVDLTRFSSRKKLLKSVAWMFRFINKVKAKVKKIQLEMESNLTTEEVEKAENCILRVVQGKCFAKEIECLKGKCGSKSPLINQFNLYMDDEQASSDEEGWNWEGLTTPRGAQEEDLNTEDCLSSVLELTLSAKNKAPSLKKKQDLPVHKSVKDTKTAQGKQTRRKKLDTKECLSDILELTVLAKKKAEGKKAHNSPIYEYARDPKTGLTLDDQNLIEITEEKTDAVVEKNRKEDLELLITACEELTFSREETSSSSNWTQRVERESSMWERYRNLITEEFFMLQSFGSSAQACEHCGEKPPSIRCLQCDSAKFLCFSCDNFIHERNPLHDRDAWVDGHYKSLLPTEALDAT